MTVLARTTRSLTLEARTALEVYVEVALEEQATPYFDNLARLGVLLGALRGAGGTWADVQALLHLHENHLDEFLDPYHARTRWVSLGSTITSMAEEATA